MSQSKISPVKKIRGAILAGVLILLIHYLVTHSSEFSVIRNIQLKYLLPVILLNSLGLLLSSIRFHRMLTHIAHRIPFPTVLKYFTHGRFINRFLPLGGTVYRALMFKKSDGVSYKQYVAINLAFDWTNMLYSTALGIIFIALYDPRLSIGPLPLLPLFGAALLLLAFAFPIAKVLFTLVDRRISNASLRKRFDKAREIVNGVSGVLKNRTLLFSNSVIITLIMGSSLISYHLLFKSVGVDTDLVVLLVYLILLRFIRVIRITPANLGIREFLLGFLSNSLGAGTAEGILVSLLMRLVKFLVQGGLSLVFIAIQGIKHFFRSREVSE